MKKTFPLMVFALLGSYALAAGEPVMMVDPALSKAAVHGATKTVVRAEGGDGNLNEALRMEVAKQPKNQWDAQLSIPTTLPVAKDDVITISMWLRGAPLNPDDGSALIELDFEKRGAPYTKSIQFPAFLSEEWELVTAKCRSAESYDQPGGAHVTLKLGFMAGWFEVAGVEVFNHGKDADFDALPSTPITYTGRDPGAAWRAEADARIEKHRKSDLRVIVVDKHGKRVSGAKVRAIQKSHDFAFGTAVAVTNIVDKSEEGERYRTEMLKYFNSATQENGLKWTSWESNWPGARNTQDSLIKLQEMGVSTRGHVMVWPGWKNLPESVKALADQPDALRQRVLEHIATMAGVTRGKVVDWDVVNEIYDNTDLTKILGDDASISWFKEARKYLPDTDLYYNDYAGLVSAGLDTGHKRHFEKTLEMLVDGGAPIDGIGIQGHFGLLLTPPAKLVEELDRWANFGLKIKITEFDIVMEDEQLQGDYTRDFLTAMFSHPAVEGVTVWGFWSKRHWRPEAAFLRDDWSERPAGKAWRELIHKTWHTETELVTDENGEATMRGFHGKYEIHSAAPIWHTKLSKGGGVVTIALP